MKPASFFRDKNGIPTVQQFIEGGYALPGTLLSAADCQIRPGLKPPAACLRRVPGRCHGGGIT